MGTVIQCVIWLIRCRPLSPSLDSACSCGRTGVRIWMTIDDVMYGNTPRAAMLMLRSPPPLNRSKKGTSELLWNRLPSAERSTPGTGTWASSRKRTSMPRTNRILARRSGVRNASIIAWMSAGLPVC